MTEKKLLTMRVESVCCGEIGYTQLVVTPEEGRLAGRRPGQFVNILVSNCRDAFLRRPISVNDVDTVNSRLMLLVKNAGPGTEVLCSSRPGDRYDVLLPLGKGFTVDTVNARRYLLIGGGVGTAPLLYLGRKLRDGGVEPCFLLGARTPKELMQLDAFRAIGRVEVSTEDGAMGVKGFVTEHPVLDEEFDRYAVCGPLPMMKAVARIAKEKGVECEVSLENKMACGLGACLCCVEDTVRGNECACTHGPVFNLNDLKW